MLKPFLKEFQVYNFKHVGGGAKMVDDFFRMIFLTIILSSQSSERFTISLMIKAKRNLTIE